MELGFALRGDAAPLWAAAAAAALAAFAAWQFIALRGRVATARAALLTALRCASAALVLALLAGPQLVVRSRRTVRRPVSIALDTSQSMGLRGGLETTRLERVRAFLGGEEFRRVLGEYSPSYFSFAAAAAPLAPEAIPALAARGAASDIEGALGASGEGAAATVVFTDGGHAATRAARDLAPAAGVPVVFVGVGAGERTRDIEIASVEPPSIAFAGQPLTVRAGVRAAGFAGREVPLLLKRGEQVLASRTVALGADGEVQGVRLEWTPPAPGTHPLTLELPVQDGEQIPGNNRVDLSVEAVRDKIRVLLVSGSPSWSYRFLRGALKGDPSLDVVSFIILRSASDAVDVPQQELSLIPFPTQKIFLEELRNFDLLIFDNFSYQPYLPAGYLDKVEEFVRAGGGFWMLGGPASYLGGRYQASPLAPLLPVGLSEPGAGSPGFRDVPFTPRLTAAGKAHPFFQGLAAGDPPPLRGYNPSGPAGAGSIVLAEVPGGPDGAPQPLVVLGRHGRGRVLSVLTDSLWNWAFVEAGRGRGNRAYLAFVRQAVRWSIGDPQLDPVRVEIERRQLAPGESIRARVRVLGEDFLPAASPELTVTLRGPGGETRALAANPESPGVFLVEAAAGGEGTWEILAQAAARGRVYGRASAAIAATWPLEEYRQPGLNRDALSALLSGRRGALLELDGADETARALDEVLADLTGRNAVDTEEPRPLAEMLPAFLLLLALLTTEWILRRRSGLD